MNTKGILDPAPDVIMQYLPITMWQQLCCGCSRLLSAMPNWQHNRLLAQKHAVPSLAPPDKSHRIALVLAAVAASCVLCQDALSGGVFQ